MNRALTQLHSPFGFFIDPSSRSLIYKPASADKVRGGSAGVLPTGFLSSLPPICVGVDKCESQSAV